MDLEEIRVKLDSYDNMQINIPFSKILDISEYSYMFGTPSFFNQNNFNSFRKIYNDGNCFYRSFIFSYLETIILTKNIYLLKNFIFLYNYLPDLKFKRKNFSVNKNQILGIFNIILSFLEDDKSILSYNFFIKSYFVFPNFDFV